MTKKAKKWYVQGWFFAIIAFAIIAVVCSVLLVTYFRDQSYYQKAESELNQLHSDISSTSQSINVIQNKYSKNGLLYPYQFSNVDLTTYIKLMNSQKSNYDKLIGWVISNEKYLKHQGKSDFEISELITEIRSERDKIVSSQSSFAQHVQPPKASVTTSCGDGLCTGTESCSTCAIDCGQCRQPFNFTAKDNQEPYYHQYCDRIDPYDLEVRKAASEAIKNDSGQYSVTQLFDIYDWVKSNINYQNVPLSGIPYSASETLATRSGDCKNQAVLIASMVGAIGGTARVVLDPTCQHAYTIVRFGSAGENLSWFKQAVYSHYGNNVQIITFVNNQGTWVIFDPAGGRYPGTTLTECTGNRTLYFMDTCMSCAQQYPETPYTYGNACYQSCPWGTSAVNKFACS